MPSDISEDFAESWEAFGEVCPYDGVLKDEAFRLLVKQAGVKAKLKHKFVDFHKLKPQYDLLIRQIVLSYLLYHLKPTRHAFKVEINSQKIMNVAEGFTISGQLVLMPQRFALDYLINRMVNLRVLNKTAFPWTARAAHTVKDRDFILLKGTKDFEIRLAKTPKSLVMRYKIFVNTPVPLYKDLEKQILAAWRQLTLGELR